LIDKLIDEKNQSATMAGELLLRLLLIAAASRAEPHPFSCLHSADDDVQSIGSDVNIEEVDLPGMQWAWHDGDTIRMSVAQCLLSGVDVTKEGNVDGRVSKDGDGIVLKQDITDSIIFDPELYQAMFMDANGRPMFNESHDKTIAYKETVMQKMGHSEHNKMVAVQKQPTGITMEQKLVQQYVPKDGKKKGTRALQVGMKGNPQNVANMELTAAKSGFWSNNPKDAYKDFTFNNKGTDADESMPPVPDGTPSASAASRAAAAASSAFQTLWQGRTG
jgi:hypothetical protein